MLVSLLVGGFVILFLGVGLIALAGDGTGHQLDLDVFRIMVVLGPLIVGACTFGVAFAVWGQPRMPARWASSIALAVSSAVVTLAFIASHRPGRMDYINKPPSILAYIAATCCGAGLATWAWQRREARRPDSL
jgi:drug/metabolite transporter (DMT)-like permease